MPFQVSPGVNVSEIDLTGIVPSVSTAIGAIAGRYQWGPMSKRVLVDTEEVYATNFGTPVTSNAEEWFSGSDFLSYSNQLWVVRVDNNANNATAQGISTIQIKNEDNYEILEENDNLNTAGEWAAKWPGERGNSIRVAMCQSANAWESIPVTEWTLTPGDTTVTSSANVASVMSAGDYIYFANSTVGFDLKIASVTNGTSYEIETVDTPTSYQLAGGPVTTAESVVKRRWEYYNAFDGAPGTSKFASDAGGANDELHVCVVDRLGAITGIAGTILERFPYLSRASDALTESGAAQYYKTAINSRSNFVWWTQHFHTTLGISGAAANDLATTTFVTPTDLTDAVTVNLSGGTDGDAPSTADYINGYNLYSDPEEIDVSLLIGAGSNATICRYLIQNICEIRKDCVALISPERTDVVDNHLFASAEAEDIVAFRNSLNLSSSYGFMDSMWKYTYDRYNDLYRYIPGNGAIAGTMALTDATRDPWWSPAGYNRGHIKNIAKLAYNPRKAQRDLLYKNGVNPVVTFPGEGTVLFGDKTLLSRPSAFDRINVRRLFIVLEKSIAIAAKYMLFEFNDAFTRAQFRNLVEPYLRDVQGRRGIYDFRVVCDESNNTPEVIDRNEFIGDIYIKPARSINFIQLNFIAVRTGVDFDEVVGQF